MGPDSKKLISAVALAFCLAGASLPFIGNRHASSFRGPAQKGFLVLSDADLPAQIETQLADGRLFAIRAQATDKYLNPAFIEAVRFISDSPYLLTEAEKTDNLPQRVLAPLLAHEGSGTPVLYAPLALASGEILDASGNPLRWRLSGDAIASHNKARLRPFGPLAREAQDLGTVRSPARAAASRKASDYRALVDSFSKRYNLNSNLVMAIIHSESNFSPQLVSNKSAMGLMQLLPSTASDEVHRFLYGRRGRVSYEELSIPEINIRYGTAYLHILNNRYFAGVRDPLIREACVIASYNMGPNGFLRLYGSNPGIAVERINSMETEEFLRDLPRRLPVRETRYYVEKVRRMKQHYADMR